MEDTSIRNMAKLIIDTGADVREATRGLDLAGLARMMECVAEQLDEITARKTAVQRVYDQLRYNTVPETMESMQLKSANLDGIGRVTITAGFFVAVPAGKQQELQQWLVQNGFEDMIKESVNSSTLTAWANRRVKEGEEVPDCVKMTPYQRASITHSS